jgi:hypothetical protein
MDMEMTTNPEAKMDTSETLAAAMWDSEKRDSPYSTVCDPNADDYCESCDQTVDYSDGSKHGKCGCDA